MTISKSSTVAVLLDKEILQLNDKHLFDYIRRNSEQRFHQPPKDLQLETVVSLAKRQHTFLLAGTGFGKSRIPEMFHNLFPASKKATILVLNPLDSHGDNQARVCPVC